MLITPLGLRRVATRSNFAVGILVIQIAFGLFEPLRGIVATLIAMDGMYADFAGAKICPRPDCAAGTISEPGRFDPQIRRHGG